MIKLGDERVAFTDSKKDVIDKLNRQSTKENRSRNNLLQQIVREYIKKNKL
jgi:metal-responsive CopG/Arc/MetJ family transcriptional regulator